MQPDFAILVVGATREVADRLNAAVRQAGIDDMRAPFGFVIRALAEAPLELTALADRLGVTKQAAGQMVDELKRHEQLWCLLAPEGTRRLVKKWKTGFWHIARAADVPVQCAWFHYPDKTIGLGAVFRMTDDLRADMERVREFYRPFQGKYHGLE